MLQRGSWKAGGEVRAGGEPEDWSSLETFFPKVLGEQNPSGLLSYEFPPQNETFLEESSSNPPHPWTYHPSQDPGSRVRPWVRMLAPPFISRVLLSKLLNLSGLQFSLSVKWDENTTYIIRWLLRMY